MKKKQENISIIEVALRSGIDPADLVRLLGTDHIKQGYTSNEGRGRCVRKDGTFDYMKMGELYHSGDW